MISGKGYFFFVDKVNDQNPKMYQDKGLKVLASNLCTEVTLMADQDHTFSCVLSSMNASKYDEWKDTDAVFTATVFLDCVNQDLIEIGKNIPRTDRICCYIVSKSICRTAGC
jgi:ribonucleoside-diphosphate reductase alpha chain